MKIYVALENIRSLFNVGAIFRTCSFFGIKNVILVGYTAKDLNGKLHPKVAKSALGSENDIDITLIDTSEDLLSFAKKNKLELIAIEQTNNSETLAQWRPTRDCVLVFGNEIDGVSAAILNKASKIIEIPRKGIHNSLNVTTALGIVLYQLS